MSWILYIFRIHEDTELERLEGLLPTPGEFHKRMLRVQDSFNMLFNGASSMDKGSLYNLKQVFNHRGVQGNTNECFNQAFDLLRFATGMYYLLNDIINKYYHIRIFKCLYSYNILWFWFEIDFRGILNHELCFN